MKENKTVQNECTCAISEGGALVMTNTSIHPSNTRPPQFCYKMLNI